jgi:hypothetical protein
MQPGPVGCGGHSELPTGHLLSPPDRPWTWPPAGRRWTRCVRRRGCDCRRRRPRSSGVKRRSGRLRPCWTRPFGGAAADARRSWWRGQDSPGIGRGRCSRRCKSRRGGLCGPGAAAGSAAGAGHHRPRPGGARSGWTERSRAAARLSTAAAGAAGAGQLRAPVRCGAAAGRTVGSLPTPSRAGH